VRRHSGLGPATSCKFDLITTHRKFDSITAMGGDYYVRGQLFYRYMCALLKNVIFEILLQYHQIHTAVLVPRT
jgi:hypothetical protein